MNGCDICLNAHRSSYRLISHKAFTIVEMLVASAGMLIISAALIMVYINMTNTTSMVSSTSSVTNQLEQTLEQLSRDVRLARNRVTVSCGSGGNLYPYDINTLNLDTGANSRVIYRINAQTGVLERIEQDAACSQTDPPTRQLARTIETDPAKCTEDFPTSGKCLEFTPTPLPEGTAYPVRYVDMRIKLKVGASVVTSGKTPVVNVTGMAVTGNVAVRYNFENPST